jgi:hypothetical protein
VPLLPGRWTRFPRHELVRPGFEAARLALRRWPRRRTYTAPAPATLARSKVTGG